MTRGMKISTPLDPPKDRIRRLLRDADSAENSALQNLQRMHELRGEATKLRAEHLDPLSTLNGSELWEMLFSIMDGNVPDKVTDEVLERLAAAIRLAYGAEVTE